MQYKAAADVVVGGSECELSCSGDRWMGWRGRAQFQLELSLQIMATRASKCSAVVVEEERIVTAAVNDDDVDCMQLHLLLLFLLDIGTQRNTIYRDALQ